MIIERSRLTTQLPVDLYMMSEQLKAIKRHSGQSFELTQGRVSNLHDYHN